MTRITSFNKRATNRLTGWIARRSHGPFALVYHVGRRSGRLYKTPFIPVPVQSGFVAALTYGKNVDWYRNVKAAGRCEVLWHGRTYSIDRIEEISAEEGLAWYSWFEGRILARLGTEYFVMMSYHP